jgi:hypothetical protein
MDWKTAACLALGWIALQGYAQDCALGLGGTDPKQIIDFFELEPWQEQRMERWLDSLTRKNSPLQQKLDFLLQTHPQQTPEELTALGRKYEAIQAEMVANSQMYDRLLLGILLPRQYRKYEATCREVDRLPLEPTSEAFLRTPRN